MIIKCYDTGAGVFVLRGGSEERVSTRKRETEEEGAGVEEGVPVQHEPAHYQDTCSQRAEHEFCSAGEENFLLLLVFELYAMLNVTFQ